MSTVSREATYRLFSYINPGADHGAVHHVVKCEMTCHSAKGESASDNVRRGRVDWRAARASVRDAQISANSQSHCYADGFVIEFEANGGNQDSVQSPLLGAETAANRRLNEDASGLLYTAVLSSSMPGRSHEDCFCEAGGSGMSQEYSDDQISMYSSW